MFAELAPGEKIMVYQGLMKIIETNTGVGFHNRDQGHPIYREGAEAADESDQDREPDSSKKNTLFQMLSALASDLKKLDCDKYEWWRELSTWQEFCKFAVESYYKARN